MAFNVKSMVCSLMSRVSSSNPVSIIITVIVVDVILSALISIKLCNLSFDEPLKGFEARGSNLASRINTWKLITGRVHSDFDQRLSISPANEEIFPSTFPSITHDAIDMEEEEEKKRLAGIKASKLKFKPKVSGKKNFFCGQLSDSYVQLVVKPSSSSNEVHSNDLFTINNLKSMCEIDAKVRSSVLDSSFCSIDEESTSNDCCKSWTLPNMIAAMKDKSSCDDITNEDIISVKNILSRCYPDYKRRLLHDNCHGEPKTCSVVPEECREGNYVYELLHYLLDTDFVENLSGTESKSDANNYLKYSNIFLPIAKSSSLFRLYNNIESMMNVVNKSKNHIIISSMDLGMRDALFDTLLVNDSRLLFLALITVSVIIWIQTKSLLVLVLTSLNLTSAFSISMLIYVYVFQVPFFPFMNVLTFIILIAVGSDNTLIYSKVWHIEMVSKHPLPVEEVVKSTLERTLTATTITSLTTSLALSASLFSDITSIKCFSIFSATCVIFQHILTTISLPSALILSTSNETNISSCYPYEKRNINKYNAVSAMKSVLQKIDKLFNKVFIHIFHILSYLKYFISIFLILVSIGLTFVFLTYLKLPETEYMPTFNEDHVFEKYESFDRNHFKFSQKADQRNSDNKHAKDESEEVPITFIFGAQAADNGYKLNPEDRGNIIMDDQFTPNSEETQQWMLNFCANLKNSSFYRPIHGPLLSNCFIETLKIWIEDRECFDEVLNIPKYPCCKSSKFPFETSTFDVCVRQATDMLIRTPTYVISRDAPGVRFDRKTSKVALVIIQFMTNISISSSYKDTKASLQMVDSWFQKQLESRIANSINGWFVIGNLELYSLQQSLSSGVYTSVATALILTLISVSLTTKDVSLTLATLSCVASIITGTLAILSYFFNWEINVVESVVLLVAIGMSVDLPLHLTMSYREQEDGLRNRTLTSLKQVSIPLFSATTLAGISLLSSSILAYQKVATFLIIISSMNILFTFVLLPALLLIIESRQEVQSQSTSEFLRSDVVMDSSF